MSRSTSLQQASDPKRGQEPLQDRREADQPDQDLQEVGEPSVADKPVDEIEQQRTDDNDDQDVNQQQEHGRPSPMRTWRTGVYTTRFRNGGNFRDQADEQNKDPGCDWPGSVPWGIARSRSRGHAPWRTINASLVQKVPDKASAAGDKPVTNRAAGGAWPGTDRDAGRLALRGNRSCAMK